MSVERRRRWTAEEKQAMVQEVEQPGMSISAVARRNGIHPNQLFGWRRLMQEGALVAPDRTRKKLISRMPLLRGGDTQ